YREDVLIIPDGSVLPWRREHKHRLKLSYLAEAVQAKPRHLILGTGQAGLMDVPDKVLDELAEQGIDTEAMPTEQALRRLEDLRAHGKSVAAALHLTC
ncbi:MAG: MTH938/NDUFAF3 family protein, partial [Armatimonadota bacterium]